MLGDVLFPTADSRRTTWSLLHWWESRRLTFNLAVGGTGLVTLVVIRLISLIPPHVPVLFDWRPILVYGVFANVCYTLGWGVEALAQRVWRDRCPPLGPALFRQGLAFSVGLTLLPIVLVSAFWVVRLGLFLFGR
jgi:hypothetical protein